MTHIGLFLVVSAGTMAMLLALSAGWKPEATRLRRRLSGEVAEAPKTRSIPLYKQGAEWDAESQHDPAESSGRLTPQQQPPRSQRFEKFLRDAGVPMKPKMLLLSIWTAAMVLGVAAAILAGWVAGTAVYVLALIVPFIALNARRHARREKYVKQLAIAFELMARALRSGQPVQEAFRSAVQSAGEPLKTEFGSCLHQIEHGIRPDEAYRELSERSGILELKMFVIAMTIQRQTGGSLTDVLDRMAVVVRTRLKLRQKIRALTAEGRMQSTTLIVLPIVTFFVMYFLNRQYAEQLLTQWKLLLATAACMGVGILWIRNIMNFEG